MAALLRDSDVPATWADADTTTGRLVDAIDAFDERASGADAVVRMALLFMLSPPHVNASLNIEEAIRQGGIRGRLRESIRLRSRQSPPPIILHIMATVLLRVCEATVSESGKLTLCLRDTVFAQRCAVRMATLGEPVRLTTIALLEDEINRRIETLRKYLGHAPSAEVGAYTRSAGAADGGGGAHAPEPPDVAAPTKKRTAPETPVAPPPVAATVPRVVVAPVATPVAAMAAAAVVAPVAAPVAAVAPPPRLFGVPALARTLAMLHMPDPVPPHQVHVWAFTQTLAEIPVPSGVNTIPFIHATSTWGTRIYIAAEELRHTSTTLASIVSTNAVTASGVRVGDMYVKYARCISNLTDVCAVLRSHSQPYVPWNIHLFPMAFSFYLLCAKAVCAHATIASNIVTAISYTICDANVPAISGVIQQTRIARRTFDDCLKSMEYFTQAPVRE
jgi:hypothetical protein